MSAKTVVVGVVASLAIAGASAIVFAKADIENLVRISPLLAAVYVGLPVRLGLRQLDRLRDRKTAPDLEPGHNGDVVVRAGAGLIVAAPLVWVLAPSFDDRPSSILILSALVFVAVAAIAARNVDRFGDWLAEANTRSEAS